MAFLARSLAAAGLETALIVWPLRDPGPTPPGLELVERPAHTGEGGVAEARHIWGARSGRTRRRPLPGRRPAAARRRRLLGSRRRNSSSPRERPRVRLQRPDRTRAHLRLPAAARAPTRRRPKADQSSWPSLRVGRLSRIPSFAEPVEPADRQPEAFVWIGRLVAYKHRSPTSNSLRRSPARVPDGLLETGTDETGG